MLGISWKNWSWVKGFWSNIKGMNSRQCPMIGLRETRERVSFIQSWFGVHRKIYCSDPDGQRGNPTGQALTYNTVWVIILILIINYPSSPYMKNLRETAQLRLIWGIVIYYITIRLTLLYMFYVVIWILTTLKIKHWLSSPFCRWDNRVIEVKELMWGHFVCGGIRAE